ncbi:hypothetical protein [Marinobacter sp.]|uniref:hypothetical protein n=1 Tax=Marinobacter sp. TaxID=50741 RepID=UPI003A936F36
MKLDNARWMISVIPDAPILIDQARTIIAANHNAAELFYNNVAVLEGITLDTLIPQASVTAHRRYVAF